MNCVSLYLGSTRAHCDKDNDLGFHHRLLLYSHYTCKMYLFTGKKYVLKIQQNREKIGKNEMNLREDNDKIV